uniref:Uncharacterized protein n=1 Tax=Streptomyces sp. NBC_00093 TaxID=2975649 RepID=A0AAU2A617_9ACTN
MQRAVYGPLCLTGDVTCLGIGEGDFIIAFTDIGVGKGGSSGIAWSDIDRIDAEFSVGWTPRALELAVDLLNFGVATGSSVMVKDSVLSISLKSGKRIAWSFGVPRSRSVGKWNRKNVKILFEELSSMGILSLLGSSVTAEQLLVQLRMVQPLLPWQRRQRIARIVTQIKKW